MNDTVAVIVTYNRKELFKECISAIIAQTYPCDILVIDNNSSDGTMEAAEEIQKVINGPAYLNDENIISGDSHTASGDGVPEAKSKNRRFIYKNTGANLGGAGGFSFGMRCAVELGYKYIWVMDDDSIPERDCLRNLKEAEKAIGSDYGFLASKVVWTDGSLCSMNIPRDTLNHKLTEFGNEPQKIVIASFVSMLIPADRIRELGLPIKEFFIWVDDWEYARRISSRYDSYLIPDSVVVHKTKDNNGADIIKDSGSRIDRYRYMYRNSVYFYRKEGVYGVFYLTVRTILHLIKVLLFSKTDKIRKCKLIISSTIEGIGFKPEIENVNK